MTEQMYEFEDVELNHDAVAIIKAGTLVKDPEHGVSAKNGQPWIRLTYTEMITQGEPRDYTGPTIWVTAMAFQDEDDTEVVDSIIAADPKKGDRVIFKGYTRYVEEYERNNGDLGYRQTVVITKDLGKLGEFYTVDGPIFAVIRRAEPREEVVEEEAPRPARNERSSGGAAGRTPKNSTTTARSQSSNAAPAGRTSWADKAKRSGR